MGGGRHRKRGMDTREIIAAVEAQRASEEKELAPKQEGRGAVPSLSDIEDAANNGENGLSKLLVSINKDQFMYDPVGQIFYIWKDHFWEKDRTLKVFGIMQPLLEKLNNAHIELLQKAAQCSTAKTVKCSECLKMQKKGELLSDSESCYVKRAERVQKKGIDRVNSKTIQDNILACACRADNSLSVDGDKLDCKPFLLACVNQTINFEEARHFPGRPADLLTRYCPTPFQGINIPCPNWLLNLKSWSNDRPELVDFIQKIIGLALIGRAMERVFFILCGCGANGKSIFVDTLIEVFGHMIANMIPSELFIATKFPKSADSASPAKLSLKGARIVVSSEVEAGANFSTGTVKNLTGQDLLTGRANYAKDTTTFSPSHTIFLMCNHLPNVPQDDKAFWSRTHVIPFDVEFVDSPDPKKPHQKQKGQELLIKKALISEASGILAWAVRGTLRYLDEGLGPIPECVLEATSDYRGGEDEYFQPFIDEALINIEGDEIMISHLYQQAFVIWYQDKGYIEKWRPKIKKFSEAMKQRLDWFRDDSKRIQVKNKGINPDWLKSVLEKRNTETSP